MPKYVTSGIRSKGASAYERSRSNAYWEEEWNKPNASHARKSFAKALLNLRELKGQRILDMGCGKAGTLLRMASEGEYVGFDVSLTAVSWSRGTFPDIPFIQGDAIRLPFKDESFDIAISLFTLPFLGNDARQALSELARVSRERVIFTVKLTEEEEGEVTLWRKGLREIAYTKHEIKRMMRKLGLKEERISKIRGSKGLYIEARRT